MGANNRPAQVKALKHPGTMMDRMRFVEIEAVVEAETEKAVLLSDGIHSAWFPKSQIEEAGPDGVWAIPVALAEKKGFV
jgi:hypothetical protein